MTLFYLIIKFLLFFCFQCKFTLLWYLIAQFTKICWMFNCEKRLYSLEQAEEIGCNEWSATEWIADKCVRATARADNGGSMGAWGTNAYATYVANTRGWRSFCLCDGIFALVIACVEKSKCRYKNYDSTEAIGCPQASQIIAAGVLHSDWNEWRRNKPAKRLSGGVMSEGAMQDKVGCRWTEARQWKVWQAA